MGKKDVAGTDGGTEEEVAVAEQEEETVDEFEAACIEAIFNARW